MHYKKTIVIILLLFGYFENYGQEQKKFSAQFDIGTSISIPYKSSVTIRTLLPTTGSSKTEYQTNIGYIGEILGNYNINNNISISSGLNYKSISYKINDGEGIIKSTGTLNTSYINIPLLLNYKFSDNFPVSISAGTYIGFLIFAREKGTTYIDTSLITVTDPNDPILNSSSNYDDNIKKAYSPVDYGISLQFKGELNQNEKASVIIFSRFNLGLKNIRSGCTDHSAMYKWENYNIVIGIGIKYK